MLIILMTVTILQDLRAQDQNERFFKAAKSNDIKTLKELLDNGIDVNVKSQYGATALTFAADKSRVEAVKLLLERGANPNAEDSFYGSTPFYWAIFKGNTEIIRFLLDHGADISKPDALFAAAQSGNNEVVRIMLEKGAAGADAVAGWANQNKNKELFILIMKITKLGSETLSSALLQATVDKNDSLVRELVNAGAVMPVVKEEKDRSSEFAKYKGVYKTKELSTIIIGVEPPYLTLNYEGQAGFMLTFKENNLFEIRDIPGITIAFEEAGGIVLSLSVNQGNSSSKYFRIPDKPERTRDTIAKAALPERKERVKSPINWPSFRGNQASGIGDGQNAPAIWDAKKAINLKWSSFIPGLAHASPVIWKEKIFIITAMSSDTATEFRVGLFGDVEPSNDTTSQIWKIYCLDKLSGKILWERKAYEGIPRVKRHPKASHANSTPATDGKYVVALYGSEGMVCYDMSGKEQWRKDLGILDAGWFFDEETQWGHSSSPVIYGNTVIVQCDRSKNSFIAAYDLKTGQEIWNTMRDEISSWGTPTVYFCPVRDELITNATKSIRGYDPKTGTELWRLSPNSEITVATPVVADSLIFITNGYRPITPVYAIKPGGSGDISIADSLNSGIFILWRVKKGGTYMPTPVAYKGFLYTLSNGGNLTCYEASSGKIIYKNVIQGGGAFTSSPVAADGKIYCTSEQNGVFVIKAGPEFELIATNPVGEICMASPAISDGDIIIRAQHHVFCFSILR